MLDALAITFREGLRAFLVAGVLIALFRQTHQRRHRTATRWGIGAAMVMTPIAALMFSTAGNQALWEGVLALFAAGAIAWIALGPARSPAIGVITPGVASVVLTGVATTLLITRGSMEIALLLGTLLWQVPAVDVILGAAGGAAVAIVAALAWAHFGPRLPPIVFRQVTTIFLVVLFLALLIDGFHEVTEANVVGGSEALHWATESFSSEGAYGRFAPYLLIGAPLAWIVVALFWGYGKTSDDRVAHMER